MRLIRLLVGTARTKAAVALAAGLLAGVLNAALIAVVRMSIGTAGGTAGGTGAFVPTPRLAAWFSLLAFLQIAATGISRATTINLAHGMLAQLRLKWARRFVTAPLIDLERIGQARVLTALTEDLSTMSDGIGVLPSIVVNTSIAIAGLSYIAVASSRSFGLCVTAIVIGALVFWLRRRRKVALYREGAAARTKLFNRLADIQRGAKELRQNDERSRMFLDEHLTPRAEEARKISLRLMGYSQVTESVVLVLTWVVVGLILFWLPLLDSHARGVAGSAIMLLYLVAPVAAAMIGLVTLSRGSLALAEVERLLSILPSGDEVALPSRAPPFASRIAVRGVTHSYHREEQGDTFQLGPIDLEINAGEILFIVGGNGSGKTTLAKVLAGLYTPEGGSISVDGLETGDRQRGPYRQLFAAVFSDCHLFDWVPVNVDAASSETVRDLLKQLGLATKVRISDDGRLSSTDLSTGQRKRLALLNAFLEDRPIFLFDEWAADQDPSYRRTFYEVILPDLKRRGRTAIVISHDDQYFHVADRIVKLEDGRVVGPNVSALVEAG